MLVHVPGVLDATAVESMRRRLEAAEWTDGRETVGAQGAQVKRNQQLPDQSPLRHELAGEVQAALAANGLFHAAALPQYTMPPRFNRYQGGGQYGFHVDGSVMSLAGHTRQVRTDVACTVFLNAPDSYEGGELIVSDTYGEHEVKLPAGDAIVYPASSLHRVTPVTRGARLAAFLWIQSLIRDDGRRRLLFEMDASIRALGTQDANRPAVVQLTGIYHNLLRMWAET